VHSIVRCLAFIGAAVLGSGALAQYPTKAVRMVIPFPGGSSSDNFARVITPPLAKELGQPVVIENRPGADGAIGADAVIKSPPDGHTLFFSTPTAVLSAPLLKKNPPYEPSRDLTSIMLLAKFPVFLVVAPNLPVKTARDFVAYAKANRGKMNYAGANISGIVLAEALNKGAGIDLVQIPFKSEVQTFTELMTGRVHANFSSGAALPLVRDGKLRALAVMLDQRSSLAPDIPTAAEAGIPPASITSFVGLFGPAQLPKPIIDRLARDLNAILKRPEVREQADRTGFHAEGSTPEQFAAFLASQRKIWAQSIKEAGIQPE
jgi:tripartite-type tricarboxylate transporter receptor subunit TctC